MPYCSLDFVVKICERAVREVGGVARIRPYAHAGLEP
jgi:hypothetical protein